MSTELEDTLRETFGGSETTSLSLEYMDLDGEHMSMLVDSLKANEESSAQLTSLDLGGNHLGLTDVEQFIGSGLKQLPRLKELDMRDNRIGPDGWDKLVMALLQSCPKIERLDVSESYVRDEGARVAATYLTKVKHLSFLSLGTNGLTQHGMVPLEVGVRRNNTLKELRLEFNNIGDEGVVTLCKGLTENKSIVTLNLSDNEIEDAGAAALAQLLQGRSSLTHLDLSVNKIGATGVDALAQALASRASRLTHLDLGCNPTMGARGREILSGNIGDFHSLRSLDLCSSGLTDEDGVLIAQQLERQSCAICQFEWFNNPDMKQSTEQRIQAALEANEAKEENTPTDSSKTPIILAGLALLCVVGYLVVRRK